MDLASLTELVKPFGQEHLLRFWQDVGDNGRQILSKELKSIDFPELQTIYKQAVEQLRQDQEKKDDCLEPLPSDVFSRLSDTSNDVVSTWYNDGLEQISLGKVAVLLLAGGQGTRLGFSHPKGMYDVGLPSGKTLYQIQGERLKKLEELAYEKFGKKGSIAWYVMTSSATRDETEEFFRTHNYFGLSKDNIKFFEQHTLPCLTNEGKLMLSTKESVARAPDGNGGLYKALKTYKIVDDMEQRGIENVQVYCVDNILIKIADPVFTGYCRSKGADCGAKAVEKVDPNEAVGVVCKFSGKYKVVEYSEISSSTAEKRADDGRLAFNAGNVCIHYFTLDFLKRVLRDHLTDLPHHVAKKKIPYINEAGELVKPSSPSGMKMEKFVFDVFSFSSKFAVLEVPREDEFSPLKNAPTSATSSPVSAKKDMSHLNFRLVTRAGGVFVDSSGKKVDKFDNAIVEVSPLLSYGGEGLDSTVNGREFSVDVPIHLKSECESNSENGTISNGKEPARKKSKQELSQ